MSLFNHDLVAVSSDLIDRPRPLIESRSSSECARNWDAGASRIGSAENGSRDIIRTNILLSLLRNEWVMRRRIG